MSGWKVTNIAEIEKRSRGWIPIRDHFGGTAYGLLFSGGLGLIAAHAPAHHRGATVAAVYLVAYILQGAIALTLGLVATASGLSTALLLGVTVIGTLAILILAAAILHITRKEVS